MEIMIITIIWWDLFSTSSFRGQLLLEITYILFQFLVLLVKVRQFISHLPGRAATLRFASAIFLWNIITLITTVQEHRQKQFTRCIRHQMLFLYLAGTSTWYKIIKPHLYHVFNIELCIFVHVLVNIYYCTWWC